MLKQYKRIPKTSELMWLLGIIIMSLGVAVCKKTGLGVSMIAAPTFILQEFLHPLSAFFSVGVTEYILEGLILIILCIVTHKFDWRFLLAFLSAVIYGYCLDLWILIIGTDVFYSVAVQWVMLLVGDCLVSLGVALFFRTYLPLLIHELFVDEVSAKFHSSIPKTKWIYDLCCLLISFILALSLFGDIKTFNWANIYKSDFHSIGLGTVVTTFINAPIIKFCGFLLDKIFLPTPLFPKLEKILIRHNKKTESNKDSELVENND